MKRVVVAHSVVILLSTARPMLTIDVCKHWTVAGLRCGGGNQLIELIDAAYYSVMTSTVLAAAAAATAF